MSYQPGLFDGEGWGQSVPAPANTQVYANNSVVYAPYRRNRLPRRPWVTGKIGVRGNTWIYHYRNRQPRTAWLNLEWTVRTYLPEVDRYLLYPIGMPREHKWYDASEIGATVRNRLMHTSYQSALQEIICSQS